MKQTIFYDSTRVLEWLQMPNVYSKLDVQSQEWIGQGKIRLDDAILYVRKDISSSSGILDLFIPGNTEAQGTQNFNNSKLPSGEHFIIEDIGFGIANKSSLTAVDKTNTYTNLYSSVPYAVYNGKLIIKQNDQVLIEQEICELVTGAVSQDIRAVSARKSLKELRILLANVPFTWQIKFADGESTGTKTYCEVVLGGRKMRYIAQ